MPTRIEKDPPHNFPSVVLYLADLKWLIETINKATESTVIINDGEYNYESLEELIATRSKALDHLSISSDSAKSPSVHLSVSGLESGFNSLYVQPALSEKGKAVYQSIRQVLDARRRPIACIAGFHELFGMKAAIASMVLGPILGWCLSSAVINGNHFTAGVLAVLGSLWLIGFVLFLLSMHVSLGRFSHVYLVNRDEKPRGLIGRNWEKIVVSLLLVILGIVVKAGWDAVWAKIAPKADTPQQTDKEKTP